MIDKELIHQAAEDIDIFEADLTEEYELLCPPKPRIIRLWPLAAAACAAGMVAILLMPPKGTDAGTPTPVETSMFNVQRSMFNEQQMLPFGEGLSMTDVQLAYQQEIKEKGERLAAYIQKQQELIDEQY
jgi:hypothetical protein